MAREQGFRRLTVAASIGGLCAVLMLTAVDVLLVARYVSAEKRSYLCVRETSPWSPTLDDFVRVRMRWDWSASLDSARWTQLAESAVTGSRLRACFEHNRTLPEHVRRAFVAWFDSDLVPSWAKQVDGDMRAFVILTLAWGLLLAGISTATPLGAFYLIRWVARGFAM